MGRASSGQTSVVIGSIEVDCRNTEAAANSAAFLMMANVFSDLESQIASASIKAGMIKAKDNGKSLGRPRSTVDDIPPSFFKHYPALAQGMLNKSEFARVCGLSRPTVYKYLKMRAKCSAAIVPCAQT